MEFEPFSHKVIIATLTKQEAGMFIFFLRIEKVRHKLDICLCMNLDRLFFALFFVSMQPRKYVIMSRFLDSEILRHAEDIEDIAKLILEVKWKR